MIKIKLKKEGKIIATENNNQVGYLDYRHPDDRSRKRNLEIIYVSVKQRYRRHGIGSNLVKFLLNKIKNEKIVWISLWTSQDIEKNKAVKFYKKLGFKKKAYQEDYYKKGIGTTLFVKRLK